MAQQRALTLADLPVGAKKTVTLGDTKVLLVRTEDRDGMPSLFALEAECPHAKAPLEQGAVCNDRLVCPWHMGTFALDTGKLLEPPPLRDLKRYPVQLAGDEIFVDPTPLPLARPEPIGAGKHLVFAGGGAATAAALCLLRDEGFAGTMTVIEPEADEPVDRTQLTKMALTGIKPLNTLSVFAPPKDAAEPAPPEPARIRAAVTQLRAMDHAVLLDNGSAVSYDALLLATGGGPKRLAVPGGDLPHVFTIRHTADLARMEPRLTPGTRVAIVGDSFIAFEAAGALRQRGLAVSVLAQSRLPFAKKFGEAVAEGLLQLHRSHGVNLHTEVEVAAISPVAVTLASGNEIPADLVLTAIGVDPITGYAPDLPKGAKGGFAVSPDLRVLPQVWTAGDIASVDGTRIEHWRLAEQHGRTAAQGMLAEVTGHAHGTAPPFAGVPLFWTFHFGKRLNYAGHADTWDAIEIDGDPGTLAFLAYYVQAGKVAAVLGCGKDTAIAALMEPLRASLTLEGARAITAAA